MKKPPAGGRLVLDEAESPDGTLQLVAYQERGTSWIGVEPKGSPLEAAPSAYTPDPVSTTLRQPPGSTKPGEWHSAPSHRRSNASR